jgi:hypothetical protein
VNVGREVGAAELEVAVEGVAPGPDVRPALPGRFVAAGALLAVLTFQSMLQMTIGSASIQIQPAADLLLIVVTLQALRDVLKNRRAHPGPSRSLFVAPCLIFMAIALASWARNPSVTGADILTRFICALVIAAAIGRWLAQGAASSLIISASIGLVVHGAVAIAQVARGETLGLSALGERTELHRPTGTLAGSGLALQPNTAAIYALTLGVLVAFGVQRWSLGRGTRVIARAGLFGAGAVIGVAFSRSAVIGLAVAFCFEVCRVVITKQRTTTTVAALGLVIAATVATGLWQHDGWVGRADQLSSATNANEVGTGRVQLMRQAVGIIKAEPLLGSGPSRYLSRVAEDPELFALTPERNVPHNLWLYVAAVLGLPALTVLLWLCVSMIRRCVKSPGAAALLIPAALAPVVALDTSLFVSTGLVLGVAVFAIAASGAIAD